MALLVGLLHTQLVWLPFSAVSFLPQVFITSAVGSFTLVLMPMAVKCPIDSMGFVKFFLLVLDSLSLLLRTVLEG